MRPTRHLRAANGSSVNTLLDHLHAWWSAGDILMPAILAVGLALYGLIGAMAWRMWGPDARRAQRADELTALFAAVPAGPLRADALRHLNLVERDALVRSFALMRALITALPLLGLLGTVAGMVATFSDLSAGGNVNASQQASSGIGLALTATQYGIALAIPGLVAECLLRQRARRLADQRTEAWAKIEASC